MLSRLVPLLTFILASHQQCISGCLKCSSAGTCLFCDVPSGFFLSNERCFKTTTPNCLVPSQDASCAVCEPGNFIDPNTRRCAKVPPEAVIAGCHIYNQFYACTVCTTGYFLSLGNCLPANVAVPNCAVQNALGICQFCNGGYLPTFNATACLPVPAGQNCLSFSYVTCNDCQPGFVANPNFYLNSFYTFSVVSLLISAPNFFPTTAPANVCQLGALPNCLRYASFSTCATCAPGHFVDNGACTPFPLPSIPDCNRYSSPSVCTRCTSGFNLVNNACLVGIPVPSCALYDGTAPVITCVQCAAGMYLSAANTCTNRAVSNSITNCQRFAPGADACATCAAGFTPTIDGLKCLPTFGNCTTYSAGSTASAPVCVLCPSGLHPIPFNGASTCSQTSIPGCAQANYQTPTFCTICQDRLFLVVSSGTCVPHLPIMGCAQYSPSAPHTCLSCAPGTLTLQVSNFCRPVPPPPACSVFNSISGCTACIPSFYLNGGVCVPVPLAWGPCVSALAEANACGTCAPGNTIILDNGLGVCTALPDYLTPHCEQVNPSLSSANFETTPTDYPASMTISCNQCVQNSLPFFANPLDSFCINANQIHFYHSFLTVFGCLRYGLTRTNPPGVVCMECQSGYFISGYWNNINLVSPISCVLGCPSNGQNIVLFDDFFGFRKICVVVGTTVANINLPACSFMARIQIQQQGVWTNINSNILTSDWRCTAPSQNSYLWLDLNWAQGEPAPAVFFPLTASSSPTSVNSATVDFLPFSVTDSAASPSILNMRAPIGSPRLFSSLVLTTGQTSAAFANCQYIMLNQRGSIFASGTGFTIPSGIFHTCLRCAFGFQISYTVTTSTSNPPYTSCVTMGSSCGSPGVVYGGLMSGIAAMVSCHVCAPSGATPTFPTVWMEQDAFSTTGNSGFLLQFALPAITGGAGDPNHGFRCQIAPTTITVANSVPPANNQVANCAVFGVFTAITAAQTVSNLKNNYCLACGSGFYPIYFGAIGGLKSAAPNHVPTYVVTQCVASANCDTSSSSLAFNTCPRCSTAGHSNNPPIFYAYTDNTLVNCVLVASRNCLIVSSSGNSVPASNNACSVCQAGYYLNADNICDSLSIPNRVDGGTFNSAYYASMLDWRTTIPSATDDALYVRIHSLLSLNNNPYGVSACRQGYIQAPPPHYGTIVCLPSQYLVQTNGVLAPTSAFINRCRNFYGSRSGGQSRYLCAKCTIGFIPNNSNTACVATVISCAAAQAAAPTLCQTCLPGFYNLNGVCINTAIENCREIATSSSSPSPAHTCASCLNGFYLSADRTSCIPGTILNCATYAQNSPTGCTGCILDFVRATLADGVVVCLPLNGLTPNCKVNESTGAFQSSIVTCNECFNTPASYFLVTPMPVPASQPASVCLPHPLIPNCLTYSAASALMTLNSLKCLVCIPGFYLHETLNACVARVNTDASCVIYTPNRDTCSSCSPGNFPDSSTGRCMAFPTGFPGCVGYADIRTCNNCTAPFFLTASKTCSQSVVIPNCVTYQANNSCTACAFGFFLANQTACIVPKATNCLTYVDRLTCATCTLNFGLVLSQNVTSCLPTNVSNCANSTQVSPFTCLACNLGFFLSNGTCRAVRPLLPRCLGYDSETTCTACAPGFLLNSTRTGCSSALFAQWGGAGCANVSIASAPQCTLCSPGFLFVNGVCTSCSSALLNSGCVACDPANTTACLWCKPGEYFMTSNLTCQAINPPANPNPPTTPFESSFALFARAFVAFVFVVLLAN